MRAVTAAPTGAMALLVTQSSRLLSPPVGHGPRSYPKQVASPSSLIIGRATRSSSTQNRLNPAHFRSSPGNFRLLAYLSATQLHTPLMLPARCIDTPLLLPRHSMCTCLPALARVSAPVAIMLKNAHYTIRIHLLNPTKLVA
jgi:hypothetical protein